jgi:hypothetical protein
LFFTDSVGFREVETPFGVVDVFHDTVQTNLRPLMVLMTRGCVIKTINGRRLVCTGRRVINISTHLLAAAYLRRQRVSFETENKCATIYISINIRCM